jgi:hypothetical protein
MTLISTLPSTVSKLSSIRMTVTPDDSALLQAIGIALLENLASLATVTLLYGKLMMLQFTLSTL